MGHNEILKHVKALYEYNQTSDKLKNELAIAFPELRESEDEKIRKEILEYFQQFEDEGLRGVNISDWIAWLEKQEVKSSPYNDVSISHDNGVDILFDKKLVKHISGEKPAAWSEEDEEMMSSTVFYLNEYKEVYQEGAQKCISWLKSLKQRYTWKPNKEQLKFLQHYADQSY